jgi:hypothetical protein
MNSLITALDIDITLPDFSSLSKRSVALSRHKLTQELAPGSIVIVDSTGLKVYGKDEWHQEKHDVAARRTWRKLHLAVDENHQIIACELTTPETGDPTAVADLLDQIDTPIDSLRNYAELAMQRYKRIFGNTMKARKLPQQKAEAWSNAVALNRMTGLGMPVSVKI